MQIISVTNNYQQTVSYLVSEATSFKITFEIILLRKKMFLDCKNHRKNYRHVTSGFELSPCISITVIEMFHPA